MFDDKLPGCFGNTDLIFAGHPNDEERAFAWLTDLRTRGIGWANAKSQVEEFLRSKGAREEHIAQQLENIEAHLRPWLLD